MSEAPVISFVTPCFNRHGFLARCIESIPYAYRSRVEHIIVDGGSTDGSVELVKNYPHVRLISEADEGLYDAANKGILLARGKYVGFLATDDFISSSFFDNFFGESGDWQSDTPVISFDFVNHSGETGRKCPAAAFELVSIFHGRTPLFSMLVLRDILIELSGFDTSYRIAGDFELALRLARLDLESRGGAYVMQNFWMHEGSLTGHGGGSISREYAEVLRIIWVLSGVYDNHEIFQRLSDERVSEIATCFYRRRMVMDFVFNWRLLYMLIFRRISFR